jgi:hypothetical protein
MHESPREKAHLLLRAKFKHFFSLLPTAMGFCIIWVCSYEFKFKTTSRVLAGGQLGKGRGAGWESATPCELRFGFRVRRWTYSFRSPQSFITPLGFNPRPSQVTGIYEARKQAFSECTISHQEPRGQRWRRRVRSAAMRTWSEGSP